MHSVPGGGSPAHVGRDRSSTRAADGWEIVENHHLRKTYRLPDFAQALALVNRIGAVAEAEDHHPDLYLAWGRVDVTIWTHKIGGLTESDFILAAKCDRVAVAPAAPGRS